MWRRRTGGTASTVSASGMPWASTSGAGKTTCFNRITGLDRPASGQIFFQGEDLLRCPPRRIVRCGIARTFQNRELFTTMSVLENVLVGYDARAARSAHRPHVAPAPAGIRPAWRLAWHLVPNAERAARDEAISVLAYLGLADYADRLVGELPFGTRRSAELARAAGSADAALTR